MILEDPRSLDPFTIVIKEGASAHFKQLLSQEPEGTALRIFVDRPGNPKAEIGMSFVLAGQAKDTDLVLTYPAFTLYVDLLSKPYLEKASIEYQNNKLSGELIITAPYLKGIAPPEEAGLAERIEYVLQQDVNPNLAHHGGSVSLVQITAEKLVVLKFGGGCHGCGMADVTLKQGIQRTLMEKFPEITGVVDATDHATGENPYYVAD